MQENINESSDKSQTEAGIAGLLMHLAASLCLRDAGILHSAVAVEGRAIIPES